jgi:hypothetical protein
LDGYLDLSVATGFGARANEKRNHGDAERLQMFAVRQHLGPEEESSPKALREVQESLLGCPKKEGKLMATPFPWGLLRLMAMLILGAFSVSPRFHGEAWPMNAIWFLAGTSIPYLPGDMKELAERLSKK